ncbi:immunoglobulin domain-containing protein [bacterium]|nr:immunoglobulin domain-containing protein [bacterium]
MILAPGESVKLSVTAVGDEPLTYQWHKDGSAIEGATSPTLALNAMSLSDTGDYTVRVTNTVGQTESAIVTVAVIQAVKIVTQPEDVSMVVGESATLKVVVEGSEPIEYFWSHDGAWIEGGTESTLRLAKVKAGDFGAYNVLVRNQAGIEISKTAQLTVISAPEIMQLTDSLTLIEGESVELSVKADSDGPLVYQWSLGGEKIEGATHPTLPLAKAVPSDAGDYTVVVSNAAGQVESGVVRVTVIQPVMIVGQPEGTSAILGDTVTLKLVVEGTEPISYFWYHDGELVEGGMESTLRLANVQSADSGAYSVIAKNRGGTEISETVQLMVLLVPEITQLTESLTLIEGESVALSVKAAGSEPLAYQWSKGGEEIDGAIHPKLHLARVAPSDAGSYTVTVSNAAGQTESGAVSVTVIQPVKIVIQQEGVSAILGDIVTLKVVAEGSEPISYLWYHDGDLVEGGTESALHLDKVQAADSGVYHLVVSNLGGTVKSKLAKLTVLLPPVITHFTESLSVVERDSVELSVSAVGSEPLAYQWSKGGEEIDGAIHPKLRLAKVAPAAAGDYTVTVSNVAGQVVSEPITVNVILPVKIVTQPMGSYGVLGESVTLTVVAEGSEPIIYNWLHNGRLIESGTQSTLTVTDLEAEDSGEYIVIVNNLGGKAISETAMLSVGLADGVYFVEDFDDLTLAPWVSDESIGDGTDWIAAPPTDWTTARGEDHAPATAVEFDGWTFLDPVSWHKTAGPERDQFTKGSGVIAVADSAHSVGKADAKFDATMATPTIDISGAKAKSLVLTYDSSWREVQRKRVVAAFGEDFEGDDVGEGVTIDGTAYQALEFVKTGAWPWLKLNGILKVTEAVFSQSGGMLIDDFSDGATFDEFEISFRMFMGRGTSRPADGLSLSIGNNLPTLTYPAEEGVPGAAFRVCFDAWDSGGGEAPAIEIFNDQKSVAIQKFHDKSGAPDAEKFVKDDGQFMMMWDNKEWADVNIRVADGLATVNFRGYDVIDSVPIDLAPIEAAQFLFAARTGGANQKHYIDDIKISLLASSTSRVSVAYDAGEPVTLLDLNSQTPTAYDESVSLALNNPEGAKSAVVTWDYQGHDNWWAIDNITVASDIEPTPALPAIATDKERYSGGKPITVSFSDGPGNPRDWIGIYRPDMTPGEQGSLAWVYVSGSTTPGDGLANGSVAFSNNLSVGDYVARFFKNDSYSQLAAAVAFTVGDPPGVDTDKLNYGPGEAITVSFSNGNGNPSDWISLMPLGETSSIDWAYVGGSRTPGDGLVNGTLKFADGLPDGEYRVLFLANDGYHQLAKANFTVAGQVEPPALGFANNGDGTITLTFEGRLQTAPTINGPWQDVGAPSPVTLPTDQPQQFTRSVR